MKKTHLKRVLPVIVCMVLIAAMALFTAGCNGNTETPEKPIVSQGKVTVLGEGEKEFSFSVIDIDGNETSFEIHTDKEIVGDALSELGLIKGDEGPYGLYVKEVNGITADFDKDGTYWAFYINDSYGVSGVDVTEIEDGKAYSFRVEKG